MIPDFKKFLLRGNVVDLAVAVIIAGAFGVIVKSFTGDIVMPVVGMFMGGVDFSQLFYALDGSTYATLTEAEEAGAAVMRYGAFVQTIVDFVIIGFVIFMVVKAYEETKKKEEAKPATPPKSEVLLEEIRDLMKK